MKINGWDISEAKAKQWNVTPGFSDIKNESEWQRGSPLPFFTKGSTGFKTIKITFLIYGSDRNQVLQNCSILISKMMQEKVILELDGFSHKFCGFLSKNDFTENPLGRLRVTKNKVGKITADFSCYEYSEKQDGSPFSESSSGVAETTITNPGTLWTPCIVEITPKIGLAKLTINGLVQNYDTGEKISTVIRNLTTDKKIILDGETGKITENGSSKTTDIDIWGLPVLMPGANRISFDSSRIDLTVKFRPRFV